MRKRREKDRIPIRLFAPRVGRPVLRLDRPLDASPPQTPTHARTRVWFSFSPPPPHLTTITTFFPLPLSPSSCVSPFVSFLFFVFVFIFILFPVFFLSLSFLHNPLLSLIFLPFLSLSPPFRPSLSLSSSFAFFLSPLLFSFHLSFSLFSLSRSSSLLDL